MGVAGIVVIAFGVLASLAVTWIAAGVIKEDFFKRKDGKEHHPIANGVIWVICVILALILIIIGNLVYS